MYGQNGKQKNDQEIKDGIFSMTPEQAEETANQFNAILDEAEIYGYRVSPEDILKVFGKPTINKLREIGYTGTIMKNAKGEYNLRPIQNYIDKRRNDIYQWIKDEKNCEERLNKKIYSDDDEKTKTRKQNINLTYDKTLKSDIKKVQAKGKKLGVGNIEQAEDALTDLENFKTELINACVGNCLTK